jgi:class 3 adenylate cyclase/tetratricopeptide (TPR) repeat protein
MNWGRYKRIWIIGMACWPMLVSAQTPGQQREIDSIWQVIRTLPKNDTSVIASRLNIMNIVKDYDTETAKRIGYETLQMAKDMDHQLGVARANMYLGRVLNVQDQFGPSLEHFLTAERLYQQFGTPQEQVYIRYQIAIAYDVMGESARAIDIYKEYIQIMRREGRILQEVKALSNLGAAYDAVKQHDLALVTYKEALRLGDSLHFVNLILQNSVNLARLYRDQKKYDEASALCEKYIPLARSKGDAINEAFFLCTLGEALTWSVHEAPEKNPYNKARHDKGLSYLLQAYEISTAQSMLREKRDLAYAISEAYSYTNEYKQANQYLLEYNALRDSVNANKDSDLIASIEDQHEAEKQRYEAEVAALKNKQQRTLLWVLGIGLAGLVFWLGLLFRLRQRSERLLRKVLPNTIANRLKAGENPLADRFSEVSVVFVDLVNFTQLSSQIDPDELVHWLNDLFIQYDQICRRHGLEKIKTIGDCYMAVAGIPSPLDRHADKTIAFARDILALMQTTLAPNGVPMQVRIGCDTGAAVAGVIGEYKFAYDLWGDTVNTAARMEANGLAGQIHCTDQFVKALGHEYAQKAVLRGQIEIKGKGLMQTWLMT